MRRISSGKWKGFGEIVVRAQGQPADPVAGRARHGQHQDLVSPCCSIGLVAGAVGRDCCSPLAVVLRWCSDVEQLTRTPKDPAGKRAAKAEGDEG
ncbi:hypothetical protein GCM10009779_02160 [Polymorphospora rubra]|uniref:Uncharacterized protein n=1 Tax=Polymorphospora rubra TaxID=338584 RepID=A0A810MXD8_9ACTN|nr:hypothetical protein Prubr_27630 [Polymorphospora rubra]